jgi:hypothetical protein
LGQCPSPLLAPDNVAPSCRRHQVGLRLSATPYDIHPAIRDEIDCRKFIAASLSRLGLALEVPDQRPVDRPSIGGYGITADDLAAMREQADE